MFIATNVILGGRGGGQSEAEKAWDEAFIAEQAAQTLRIMKRRVESMKLLIPQDAPDGWED